MRIRVLIIGLAIAGVAVVLYGLSQLLPQIRRAAATAMGTTLASQVGLALPSPVDALTPGFTGVIAFGPWRLICSAEPAAALPHEEFPVGPDSAVDPPRVAPPPNACRVNQEVTAQDQPNQILLAANLAIVGSKHSPALMLRLPPAAHAGDIIQLRLAGGRQFETPIRDCTDTECVAATTLSKGEWQRLITSGMVDVVFPVAGGQRVVVPMTMTGLAEAAHAMTVAQNAPVKAKTLGSGLGSVSDSAPSSPAGQAGP